MPELTVFELLAWPALAAGFGWFWRGPRAIAPVWAGAFALIVLALWFGSPEGGANRVMLLRPRKSRIFYQGQFFKYPVSLDPDTLRKLGARRTLRIGASYARATLRPRPEHSLEDFLINRFGLRFDDGLRGERVRAALLDLLAFADERVVGVAHFLFEHSNDAEAGVVHVTRRVEQALGRVLEGGGGGLDRSVHRGTG